MTLNSCVEVPRLSTDQTLLAKLPNFSEIKQSAAEKLTIRLSTSPNGSLVCVGRNGEDIGLSYSEFVLRFLATLRNAGRSKTSVVGKWGQFSHFLTSVKLGDG